MGSNTNLEQLNILIVGAGIAGLTAATALKHAGHKVTIFESSEFLREVGAAVTLAPNGSRVLAKLGFDFSAARGVRIDSIEGHAADTLENKHVFPPGATEHIEERFGFPHRAFHRVDLHNELKKMALKDDGIGHNVDLNLGVKIVRVDVDNAEIEMDSGKVWKGDLLIGADGIHSRVRKAALGLKNNKWEEYIESEGCDIFRWLLDTKVVEQDAELQAFIKQGRKSFVYPYQGRMLSLVWYACRDGELQNLAAFSPSEPGEDREDYHGSADKDALLSRFHMFHPSLLGLIEKADMIKFWRIRYRTPLETYVYGKTLLIGDAAHPMLPWNAQGANQALEDCGALFTLFSNLRSGDLLPERMRLFDQVRRKRANRQQILSSVLPAEVKRLGGKIKGYESEGPIEGQPEVMGQRLKGEYGYDIFERCKKALEESGAQSGAQFGDSCA
ncbi:hypothetical protein F5884DRAFT_905998 [Xylogone sp. PMI_703]|nr:hypothetical protein F5884DRAFT_905998 [Xylogone sp. PMI_703]